MVRPTRSPKGAVKKYSISLSPEAAAKLEAFCQKRERPYSWVFNKLVTLYNLEKLQ